VPGGRRSPLASIAGSLDHQDWIASHAPAIDVIEAGGQRWFDIQQYFFLLIDEIDVHSIKRTPIKRRTIACTCDEKKF
jgi:hypothetical protein